MAEPARSDPYLSVVCVSRNDNYGEHLIERLNAFLRYLSYFCNKYEIPSELVLVEWNPPPDQKPLREVIHWPPDRETKYLRRRLIRVPPELHEAIKGVSNRPLFEFMGKNVGIRRAAGQFILCTNQDNLFSEEVFRRIAQFNLKESTFYRLDRLDVRKEVMAIAEPEEMARFCQRNVVLRHGYWASYASLWDFLRPGQRANRWVGYAKIGAFRLGYWLFRLPFLRPRVGHTNAAGDFFLAGRKLWHVLRGYAELEPLGLSRNHIDTFLVWAALSHNYSQTMWRGQAVTYHIIHQPAGVMQLREYFRRFPLAQQLYEKKYAPNGEDWGLGTYTLAEEWV
ncbi:MAG: hypothetical protein NZ958_02705 [Bacteroidia bacterium]|nr:hypothetical protein [Bacteroidia bacterium]MDW8089588.1 hypothetical protein [Bacteroidia bacterium]